MRYDLFEGIVTVTSTFQAQPFQEGFGLKCGSNDFLVRRGVPAVLLTVFIFDSPEHAQQAFEDKGIKPSPQAGVSHGTFDLAFTRSQWTATSELLKGVVFDGNLRIEGEVYEIGPNGQSADILKRFTDLLGELVKELRRMAAQPR